LSTIDWVRLASEQNLEHIDGVDAGEPGCTCTVHSESGFVLDYDCGEELRRKPVEPVEPNRFTDEDFFLAVECIMSSAEISRSAAICVIRELQHNQFKIERNSNG